MAKLERIRTSSLEIAYEESGSPHSPPVVLLHGFPYDPRCFDDVVSIVTAAGLRAIVPYLRGYGGTRFLSPDTMRSGQQAAVGHDLRELLDALDLRDAVLAGFDWGARAACVVAALWPERVRGLVTVLRLSDPGHRPVGKTGRPPSRSTGSGTSTTSTPNAGAPASQRTAARSGGCSGSSGRPPGSSTTPPTSAPPRRSGIPTSWTW